ncbi:hypothetical protein [Peribacillus sp. NPDC096540]
MDTFVEERKKQKKERVLGIPQLEDSGARPRNTTIYYINTHL